MEMVKGLGKSGGAAPREDTLAEIQARLEVCEEDMDGVSAKGGVRRPRAEHTAEEADEIDKLLEELMTSEGGDTEQP